MLRLYQAQDELEAQMLVDYLANLRIEAIRLGAYQSGAAGELSAMNFPVVCLLDHADEAIARTHLATFLARPNESDRAWRCASCGTEVEANFDLCWQCGAGRLDD